MLEKIIEAIYQKASRPNISTNPEPYWNEIRILEVNKELENMKAVERVEWSFENLPSAFALSSSFGIQSAVSLHMLTQIGIACMYVHPFTVYV